jgi:hypothetical protein
MLLCGVFDFKKQYVAFVGGCAGRDAGERNVSGESAWCGTEERESH